MSLQTVLECPLRPDSVNNSNNLTYTSILFFQTKLLLLELLNKSVVLYEDKNSFRSTLVCSMLHYMYEAQLFFFWQEQVGLKTLKCSWSPTITIYLIKKINLRSPQRQTKQQVQEEETFRRDRIILRMRQGRQYSRTLF